MHAVKSTSELGAAQIIARAKELRDCEDGVKLLNFLNRTLRCVPEEEWQLSQYLDVMRNEALQETVSAVFRQLELTEHALVHLQDVINQVPITTPAEGVAFRELRVLISFVLDYLAAEDFSSRLRCYEEAIPPDMLETETVAPPLSSRFDAQASLKVLRDLLIDQLKRHFDKILRRDPVFSVRLETPVCTVSAGRIVLRIAVTSDSPENPPPTEISLALLGEMGSAEGVFPTIRSDDGPVLRFVAEVPYRPQPVDLSVGYGEVKVMVYYRKSNPLLVGVEVAASPLQLHRVKFTLPYVIPSMERPAYLDAIGYGISEAAGAYFVGREVETDSILRAFKPGGTSVQYLLYGQHYCGKSTLVKNVQHRLEKIYEQEGKTVVCTFENAQSLPASGYETALLVRLAKIAEPGFEGGREAALSVVRNYGQIMERQGSDWIVFLDELTTHYSYVNMTYERESNAWLNGRAEYLHYLETIRTLVDCGTFSLLATGQEDTADLIEDSYFFNAVSRFQRQRLTYLNQLDIRRLAMVPMREYDAPYRGDTLDRIVKYSGCHPRIAHQLLHQVFEVVRNWHVALVSDAVLDEAVRQLTESSSRDRLSRIDFEPFFFLRTAQCDEKVLRRFYLKLLQAARNEGGWVNESTFSNDGQMQSLIGLLCDRDILDAQSGCLRLKVPLFERWMRNNRRNLQSFAL